ncbi:MAG: hypothetical protein HY547_10215 [Elusimicrobia bacterium]|nr:hypothetical protein [Elusimicrobiota bacterium]
MIGLEPQKPPVQATIDDILMAHAQKHWDNVISENYDNADTPREPGIDQMALTSLSGYLSATNSSTAGQNALSLMRPPGQHAAS